MDRYAGKEWLPSHLKHLDFPARERADVIRGLRTYVGRASKFPAIHRNVCTPAGRATGARAGNRHGIRKPVDFADVDSR